MDENKSLLHRTKISQAHVIFDNCTITSGEVGLYEADLEDGANIRFHRARLKGGQVRFTGTRFNQGSLTDFSDAEISGCKLVFDSVVAAPQVVDLQSATLGENSQIEVNGELRAHSSATSVFGAGIPEGSGREAS